MVGQRVTRSSERMTADPSRLEEEKEQVAFAENASVQAAYIRGR